MAKRRKTKIKPVAIKVDRNGQFYGTVTSPESGDMLIKTSEAYHNKHECLQALMSGNKILTKYFNDMAEMLMAAGAAASIVEGSQTARLDITKSNLSNIPKQKPKV